MPPPPKKSPPRNYPMFSDAGIYWSSFLEYFKNYRSIYFLVRVGWHCQCRLAMCFSTACTPWVLLSILRQSCHWDQGKFRLELGWDEGYHLCNNISSAAVGFCGIWLIFLMLRQENPLPFWCSGSEDPYRQQWSEMNHILNVWLHLFIICWTLVVPVVLEFLWSRYKAGSLLS